MIHLHLDTTVYKFLVGTTLARTVARTIVEGSDEDSVKRKPIVSRCTPLTVAQKSAWKNNVHHMSMEHTEEEGLHNCGLFNSDLPIG